MGKLQDRVVVITGANQGIGKGIAARFAAEGARLALCARNAEKLRQVAQELTAAGASVFAEPVDVSQEGEVVRFFKNVQAHYGRIDILVNNAGAFDGGPFETLSLDAWNNVIGACLTGAFLCAREAFARMKEQGGGRILNIGSISAQRTRANSAPYTAAKFGVWGLTQSIALDGRPFGINCGCLHPGNVAVERRQNSGKASDEEPMMETSVIADAALAMVTVPPAVNFLEAIVLPTEQEYIGRG